MDPKENPNNHLAFNSNSLYLYLKTESNQDIYENIWEGKSLKICLHPGKPLYLRTYHSQNLFVLLTEPIIKSIILFYESCI